MNVEPLVSTEPKPDGGLRVSISRELMAAGRRLLVEVPEPQVEKGGNRMEADQKSGDGPRKDDELVE
jgi:hypothetical protein